jgi:tetratricopeptide (TPR) repeat protein
MAKHFPPYNVDTTALERAKVLFYKALKYDSTFAEPYAALALIYSMKNWLDGFSANYRDSALTLINMALSYDDQLAEAYAAKGLYYWNFDNSKAIEATNKALELNPNDFKVYFQNSHIYTYNEADFVKAIDNCNRAASLHRGFFLPAILRRLSSAYNYAGFFDQAIFYSQEALKLDDNAADHYMRLGISEYLQTGKVEKAIEILKKGYAIDSTYGPVLKELSHKYMLLGQNEEALHYLKEHAKTRVIGQQFQLRFGYIYWQLGNKEKAEDYFNEVSAYYNRINELGLPLIGSSLNLARVYAFRGEKEEAYKILRTYIQSQVIPSHIVADIKGNPIFNGIRDEPEFQQIVRDVESNHEAEHERVRKWLEENDML